MDLMLSSQFARRLRGGRRSEGRHSRNKTDMNSKLADFFPWGAEHSLRGKAVLLLDEHIPGSNHTAEFLLTSMLLKYCNSSRGAGPAVALVLCNHSAAHYESILRKNVCLFSSLRQTLADRFPPRAFPCPVASPIWFQYLTPLNGA